MKSPPWMIAALIALMVAGCLAPKATETCTPQPDVPVVDVDPEVTGSAVSFSMNSEQFSTLAQYIGHENTLTIEKPVHTVVDNATLDAKAGTRFSYKMADKSGVFIFEKPFPTIHAGIANLIGGVSLQSVTINSDGSGVAGTGLGKYRFRWMSEDEGGTGTTAAPNELSEVWCYSQPGCQPCVRARLELAAAKDLPFTVVWKDDTAPKWIETRPTFWWHVTDKQPSQADVTNTRQNTGWNGIKDFVGRWNASRSPKKYQRAGGPASPPFVQPGKNDLDTTAAKSSQIKIPNPSTIWTHPGNIRDHLKNTHQWKGPLPLSDYDCERLHSAIHEGKM